MAMDQGSYIVVLKPNVQTQLDGNGEFKTQTETVSGSNGNMDRMVIDTISDTAGQLIERNYQDHETAATHFTLLQTRGYMSRHRPCYVVSDTSRQKLVRLTTQYKDYMDLSTTNMAGKSDFYEPTFPEAQILRFKMATIEPRDSSGNIDFDKATAGIIDMSAHAQTASFDVSGCGDGVHNMTARYGGDGFELCEYYMDQGNPSNKVPPLGSSHPNHYYYTTVGGTGSYFPEQDSNTSPANHTVVWMTGYKHDFYSAGITTCVEDEDTDCIGYFTCNEKCRLVQYNGCGDGVASNGPPETSAWNDVLEANQRTGTYTFEECDDGNNDDGDGCSSTCTIEPEYECLEWGQPCTPLCGNGRIEVYEVAVLDSDGNTLHAVGEPKPVLIDTVDSNGDPLTYRVEECDFGSANNIADGTTFTSY